MTSRILAAIVSIVLVAGCGIGSGGKGSVSDASGTAAADAQPAQEIPTWGERYTWPDGLAVEVAAPVPCVPGKYAFSSTTGIQRAVKFTFTIVNGTDENFDAGVLTIGSNAQFNGSKADEIYDSNGECGGGFESATVLPGKTFTSTMAFAVGPEPGEMQIALQPTLGGDEAVFVGQA